MRLRVGLIVLCLTACFCSALLHMTIPGQVNATDRPKQGRHSLIVRPSSPLSASPALDARPTVTQRSTPPSLVVPLYSARDRAGSLPAVASTAR
jgi:hypothetical protein